MMRRCLLAWTIVSTLSVSGVVFAHGGKHKLGDDRVVMPRLPKAMKSDAGPRQRQVVWLNANGGTFTSGWEDSGQNVSSVLYGRGLGSVDIPAFGHSAATWNKVVSCVQGKFAAFDLEITDQRPDGDYIEAVVGGTGSLLGLGRSVGGIAPYTGDVISKAVVFSFSKSVGNDVESVCEVTAHEIGHALGLDHAYYCQDPMTYLQGCGDKTFQDVDMPCGENEERECASGQATQNSFQILAHNVGLAQRGRTRQPTPEPPAARPEPPTASPEPTEPTQPDQPTVEDPGDSDNGDTTTSDDGDSEEPTASVAPDVEIVSPEGGARQTRNSWVTISIRATAQRGVGRVELGWASDRGESKILTCGALPEGAPVTCTQEADLTVFRLQVGYGRRAFQVRVTDNDGNQTESEVRLLRFD